MTTPNDSTAVILRFLSLHAGKASVKDIMKETGINPSTLMRTVLDLKQRGNVEILEKELRIFTLTEEGQTYARKGLPERQLAMAVLKKKGVSSLQEAALEADLNQEKARIALGWLVKKKWGSVERLQNETYINVAKLPPETGEEPLLRTLLDGELKSSGLSSEEVEHMRTLVRRNLVHEKTEVERTLILRVPMATANYYTAPHRESIALRETVSTLTSEIITSGRWREVTLREYDVAAQPPKVFPAKKHFYRQFLEEVGEILVAMGFEEYEGPFVETEFWNYDVLFQAQDHPAREIHDSFQVKTPSVGNLPPASFVDKIRQVHENGWRTASTGWRYKWSLDIARRLVLRTQTTSVSARYLYQHPKPPVKMFCISKVFRPDVLDSKHSLEFSQCEGIMMAPGLNLRHLLGFLQSFAGELKLGEVRFRPGYFPFTEPSVECFIRHPTLGWVEFVGAGMFRPEVLMPLDVKLPVLAWGIGIDRLAMAKLGIEDIRELHSKRLDYLRTS